MRLRRRRAAAPALLAGTLLLLSCGDGGTGVDAVSEIRITPSPASMVRGQSLAFTATVLNGAGRPLDEPVAWTVTDETVATVDASGVVTAVAEGATTLVATAEGVSGSADLTVSDPFPPESPTDPGATALSATEIQVTWTDGATTETEVRVERRDPQGASVAGSAEARAAASAADFQVVATLAADATAFTDQDLAPWSTYAYRVLACNENGCSPPSAVVEATTDPVAPSVTTAGLDPVLVGTSLSVQLQAAAGDGTYAWEVVEGDLPGGVTLSAAGVLAGTPQAPGDFAFTVRVTSAGLSSTADLLLRVLDVLAVATQALPDAVQGEAYEATLEATGGDGDTTWEVTEGAPPAGVTLAPDGILSGTPTGVETAAFTVRASSGDGQTASAELSLEVFAPLTVTTGSLPDGAVAAPYHEVLGVTGGDGLYVWSLVGGSLPPGLSLDVGAVTGTPQVSGSFQVTLRVLSGDGQFREPTFSITVAAAPVEIATEALPPAALGEAYSRSLEATGGDGVTYAWEQVGGALPPGLSVGADGVVSGVPGSEGDFEVQVRVTSGGFSATGPVTLTVGIDPVAVVSPFLGGAYVGEPFQGTLMATGGDWDYEWSIVDGGLPPGLSLDPSTGVVSGVPTTPGVGWFTVRAGSHGLEGFTTVALAVSTAPPEAFNLWVLNATDEVPSEKAQAALDAAVARWEEVVTGELPDFQIPQDFFGESECFGYGPLLNGVSVEDMVAVVDVTYIDGRSKVLAQAMWCMAQGDPLLTGAGFFQLEEVDVEGGAEDVVEAVVIHEIGHVLGIGTQWDVLGHSLIVGKGGPDPRFVGEGAVAQYHLLGGPDPDVPAEGDFGPGARDVHWDEGAFNWELMTPIVEFSGTPMPLSVVSIASLTDLGYPGVVLEAADPYTLPSVTSGLGAPERGGHGVDVVPDIPVWILRPDGTGLRIRRR